MPFCYNCGAKLPDGSNFCPECGTPVKVPSQERQYEYAGKIIKCPCCGETLKSFVSVCPACGYELRGSKATNSIESLKAELQRIDAKRTINNDVPDVSDPAYAKNIIAKQLNDAFNIGRLDPVDNQLANTITNFAIPNTQEDIIEFLILASSNIDPAAYDNSSLSGYRLYDRTGKRLISDAWLSKYNQAIQKAKIMFPSDPRLKEIEDLYKSKQRQVDKGKSHTRNYFVTGMGMGVAFVIIFFIIFCIVIVAAAK